MRKMKKLMIFLLVLTFLVPTTAFGQDQTIRVKYNDQYLQMKSTPIIDGENVLIPLRGFFEALGAEVSWNQANNRIVVKHQENILEFKANSSEAFMNGQGIQLAEKVLVKSNTSYINPVVLTYLLGYQVGYNPYTSTLVIVDFTKLFEGIEIKNQELIELLSLESSNQQELFMNLLSNFQQGRINFDFNLEGVVSIDGYGEEDTMAGDVVVDVEALIKEGDYSLKADYQMQLGSLKHNVLMANEEGSLGLVKLGDYLYEKVDDVWYKEKIEDAYGLELPYAFSDLTQMGSANSIITEDTYDIAKLIVDSTIEILDKKEITKTPITLNGETLYEYRITIDKKDYTSLFYKIAPRLFKDMDYITMYELIKAADQFDGSLDMIVYADASKNIKKEVLELNIQYTDNYSEDVINLNLLMEASVINNPKADQINSIIKFTVANESTSLLEGELSMSFAADMNLFTQSVIDDNSVLYEGAGSFKVQADDYFMSVDLDMNFNFKFYLIKEEVTITAPTGIVLEW